MSPRIFSSFPKAIDNILSHILWAVLSCLADTRTPGGEVNYMVTRLSPELPQF